MWVLYSLSLSPHPFYFQILTLGFNLNPPLIIIFLFVLLLSLLNDKQIKPNMMHKFKVSVLIW
jgi:hypothetical protein